MDRNAQLVTYDYFISMKHEKILNDIFYIYSMKEFYRTLKKNINALNLLRSRSLKFSPARPVPAKHKNYGQNKYSY